MLLRLRVVLPDRPGSLGQVARTLGVAGADIVQIVVLERLAGRAVDDITVLWPAARDVDRILRGLAAVPGVVIDGMWRAVRIPPVAGADAYLLGQLATNPDGALPILVDEVSALVGADWAAAVVVPADWATGSGDAAVAYASWGAPDPVRLPDVTPMRPRALDGADGIRYAVVPFGRAGLVLVVARDARERPAPPAFHRSEVERIAQLVGAAATMIGDRLDRVTAPPRWSGPAWEPDAA